MYKLYSCILVIELEVKRLILNSLFLLQKIEFKKKLTMGIKDLMLQNLKRQAFINLNHSVMIVVLSM